MTYSIGTVEEGATAGANVAVKLHNGTTVTADHNGAIVYAGEDLAPGTSVVWANWLIGCAVVDVDTERELPEVNARLVAAEKKLDGDRLERILHGLIVDHPMWIDDGNNTLTPNPTRDVLIDDYVEAAVRAIQADG